MGDFDINPAGANAHERRKTFLAILLGGVLAAVVGFHYFGHSPKEAVASGSIGNAASGAPQDTAAQVRHTLEEDPTRGLLANTSRRDPSLENIPHNPFRMSSAMRSSLTKPPAEIQVVRPIIIQDPPAPGPVAPKPSVKTDNLKLSSIFQQGGQWYAIINGNVVTTGGTFADARVLDVQFDRVVLQHIDYSDGPRTTILLYGRGNQNNP